MSNASKPTITKVSERGHVTNFKDAETTEWDKEFILAWFLSARALAAFAWVNVFALTWSALLGIVPLGWNSAAAFVFFLFVTLAATGAASKKGTK